MNYLAILKNNEKGELYLIKVKGRTEEQARKRVEKECSGARSLHGFFPLDDTSVQGICGIRISK